MIGMEDAVTVWPDLPYASWRETAATLQVWTQIVGKVRLTLTPWLNHGWQVPLYVTACGLSTSPIPAGSETQTFVRDQAAGTRKRVGLSGWSRV
jgi:hypothetical protein